MPSGLPLLLLALAPGPATPAAGGYGRGAADCRPDAAHPRPAGADRAGGDRRRDPAPVATRVGPGPAGTLPAPTGPAPLAVEKAPPHPRPGEGPSRPGAPPGRPGRAADPARDFAPATGPPAG